MGYRDDHRDTDRRWDQDRRQESGRRRDWEEEDRGFFDRAGDEVRSWFGDEDAHRRRERDYRDEAPSMGRSNRMGSWGRPERWSGDDSFGGGWGNQAPPMHERGRWSERGSERDRSDDEGDRYWPGYEAGYRGGQGPVTSDPGSFYAAPGFDAGFAGPRFDRADVGSTGTHGVHPVSSSSGRAYGGGYGTYSGGFESSARSAAMMRRADRSGGGYARAKRELLGEEMSGRARMGMDRHDPHYAEWRQRQIEELDRDYDDYRREHQSKFDQEFSSWREKRQGQRQSMRRVTEHMEVVGSDGQHIGTVDKVRGDRIILTKSDPSSGGIHHSVPCSWIDRVEDKVHVNRTADQAMQEWRDEERNRALFEREDSGSEGPHMLNRSFAGTYRDDES